jgi:hypothetical protein
MNCVNTVTSSESTDQIVMSSTGFLPPTGIIVDGGNGNWRDPAGTDLQKFAIAMV